MPTQSNRRILDNVLVGSNQNMVMSSSYEEIIHHQQPPRWPIKQSIYLGQKMCSKIFKIFNIFKICKILQNIQNNPHRQSSAKMANQSIHISGSENVLPQTRLSFSRQIKSCGAGWGGRGGIKSKIINHKF